MSLTTEQKINLLVLAGFEPYLYAGRQGYARMFRGDACLVGTEKGAPWEYNSNWGLENEHKPSEWKYMGLASCPDKLIYQAIEATGG